MPSELVSHEVEASLRERVTRIAARSLSGASTNALLEQTLDAVMLATGTTRGNVQRVNRASGALEIAVQRGFGREFLDHFAAVRRDGCACAAALHDRESVTVADVATSPLFDEASRGVMLRAQARAVQSTPLLTASGEVLGMVSSHRSEPGEFSPSALENVQRLARQAAALLELRVESTGFERSLSDLIRLKLEAGILPSEDPKKIWGGLGDERTCSACDSRILPCQAEYEVEFACFSLRFHLACFDAWVVERETTHAARMGSQAK